jgi:hypothetical protein
MAVGGGVALGAMALYFAIYSFGVERAMPALAATENWQLIESFGKSRGGANDISSFFNSVFLYFVVILLRQASISGARTAARPTATLSPKSRCAGGSGS